MLKAVFFDMTEVLFFGDYKDAVISYEHEFNIPEGEFYDIIHNFSGWTDWAVGKINKDEFYKMCEERSISRGYKFYRDRFDELLRLVAKPNFELIDFIKNDLKDKFIIGIISNSPIELHSIYSQTLNVENFVDLQIISSVVGYTKPNKEIFEFALSRSDIKPEEAVYVDDREHMMAGAKDVGINCIVYSNFEKFKNDFNNLIY